MRAPASGPPAGRRRPRPALTAKAPAPGTTPSAPAAWSSRARVVPSAAPGVASTRHVSCAAPALACCQSALLAAQSRGVLTRGCVLQRPGCNSLHASRCALHSSPWWGAHSLKRCVLLPSCFLPAQPTTPSARRAQAATEPTSGPAPGRSASQLAERAALNYVPECSRLLLPHSLALLQRSVITQNTMRARPDPRPGPTPTAMHSGRPHSPIPTPRADFAQQPSDALA